MHNPEIKDQLAAIPGIAEVEVTLRDGEPPQAQVWLDGSRSDSEVQERIDALLGRAVPDVETQKTTRRTGLGKGLDALIPDADSHAIPSQLWAPQEGRGASIERVAVVEGDAGVAIEIEDGAGSVFHGPVDATGSIDGAVIRTTLQLAGAPNDVICRLNEVEIDGSPVLVATVEHEDRRAAGAAIVSYGRPFAVARAVRQALTGI